MVTNRAAVLDAAPEAAGLLQEFPKRMKQAPILEKKLMIRRLVQSIVADREAEQVEVTLRRLPRTNNPILKSILQDGVVQSSVCPEPELSITYTPPSRD